MTTVSFETTIKGFGNNAGIEVPSTTLEALGAGKRPPVIVTIGNYSWKSTVGVMNGMFLISLSKAHRTASGLAASDKVLVKLERDEGLREVEVPLELQMALKQAKLSDMFAGLAYSKRKEYSRQITEAKSAQTKERRLIKIIDSLH
jgi:putative transposon-encoded protein